MSKSDLLLAILSMGNGTPIRGKTRLVKLTYIASIELKKAHKDIDFYEFRRHYYGPYSDEINDDLETLIAEGFIRHEIVAQESPCGIYEENTYQITARGVEELERKWSRISPDILRLIEQVKTRYNNMPLTMLIQEVYAKYSLPKQ